MERTAHSAEPVPKQSSFSPSPFIKFLLILPAPLPSFFLSLFRLSLLHSILFTDLRDNSNFFLPRHVNLI